MLKDGTYNYLGQAVEFNKGYQVSVDHSTKKLSLEVLGHVTLAMHKRFGSYYIGVWQGVQEISYHIDNIEDALKYGRLFDQDAIWDWANGCAIYLKEVV
jgi:hypothetical protein